MRTGIFHQDHTTKSPSARGDRQGPYCRKHVWRANIVLLSADGVGTNEIGVRQTGTSKTMRLALATAVQLRRRRRRPPARQDAPLAGSWARPGGGRACVRASRWPEDPPTETTHWTVGIFGGGRAGDISAVRGPSHLERGTGSNLTGADSSSSRTIQTSSPSCATPSASRSIRRPMRSCCRSMRKARSKPSTAPSPACR